MHRNVVTTKLSVIEEAVFRTDAQLRWLISHAVNFLYAQSQAHFPIITCDRNVGKHCEGSRTFGHNP